MTALVYLFFTGPRTLLQVCLRGLSFAQWIHIRPHVLHAHPCRTNTGQKLLGSPPGFAWKEGNIEGGGCRFNLCRCFALWNCIWMRIHYICHQRKDKKMRSYQNCALEWRWRWNMSGILSSTFKRQYTHKLHRLYPECLFCFSHILVLPLMTIIMNTRTSRLHPERLFCISHLSTRRAVWGYM